jgi:hypothetical protein
MKPVVVGALSCTRLRVRRVPAHRILVPCFNRSAALDLRRRLADLVGDDDQNICAFRGASLQYIHRFREDYDAESHYLVENYRSSGHIIAAANALIAKNRERMKGDHPVRIDRRRVSQTLGGRWESLDALTKGRVLVLRVAPELIDGGGRLGETLSRLHEDIGRAGAQTQLLEQPVNRRFRGKAPALIGDGRGQFPRGELRLLQDQFDDFLRDLWRHHGPDPSGRRLAVLRGLGTAFQVAAVPGIEARHSTIGSA